MEMIVGKKYFLDFKDPNYPCRCDCHSNNFIMHCVPCCYDHSYNGEGTLIEIINEDWFIFSRPERCPIKLHRYSVVGSILS